MTDAGPRARIARPLLTIVLVQSLTTSVTYGISVIAPDAAPDLGLRPEAVGFLASTLYAVAMVTGLGSEALVARAGPTRTFQLLTALAAFGCLALMAAHPVLAFLGAALAGAAMGPMNPAGSYVLARVTPAIWQPMVFSLKQCATPMGGMLAGALLPPLALLYDWRLALAMLPAAAVVLILAAPRGGLEVDAARARPAQVSGIAAQVLASLRDALATPALRAVVLIGYVLGKCQLGVAAYFVVFLWSEAGMTPVEAGRVFVAFHVSGIVTRIVLGAVAERHVPTRVLLPALGLVMGVATAAAAGFDAGTPRWWIYAVTIVLGAGGNGWVGLYFAELARLAPHNTAGVTGGAQFAMYVGIFVGPLLYGLLLEAGLGHGGCLWVFAVLAASAALAPLVVGRRGVPHGNGRPE